MPDHQRSVQSKIRYAIVRDFFLRWSLVIEHDHDDITHGTTFFLPRISRMGIFLSREVDRDGRKSRSGLTQAGRHRAKKLLSFVCLYVDVSFSSRINHRTRAANTVFKTDVLCESKKISAWNPGDEIDDRIWPLSVISSFAHCKAEFDLGKMKIGERRRIHTQKTKIKTIIDTRIRVRVGESKWSPRSVARYRSMMFASWCSVQGSCGTSLSSDPLVAGLEHSRPLVGLEDSVATGSG